MPQDQPQQEPTAALTSRNAVVASLLLFGAILLAVVVLQGCAGDEADDTAAEAAQAGPVLEGMAAPDFTLTSLEGESVSLCVFAGQPVLIIFWASWCPPCGDVFPVLAEARVNHGDAGFEILGVTHNDLDEQSRKFVSESGAEWPMLPDGDDAAWDRYGPVGLPTSYFVDGAGVVQRVHIGPVTDEQLANHLAAIGL